jgi:hypothetical protein
VTPTRHQLFAALRAGAAIGGGADFASTNESYLRLPTEGLYDRETLMRGAALLRELGLLVEEDALLVPDERLGTLLQLDQDEAARLLLALVMDRSAPLWLRMAAGADRPVAGEFLPHDVEETLASLIPDVEAREALLLALASKFDADNDEKRSERGLAGEKFIAAACVAILEREGRSELASRVRHVSLISDQLGYDVVAPNLAGDDMRLEVKTTSRPPAADVSVFLSHNEARAGSRDSRWRLVICATDAGEHHVLGSCSYSTIAEFLPVNTQRGRWVSCQVRIPESALARGLLFLTESAPTMSHPTAVSESSSAAPSHSMASSATARVEDR